MKGEPMGRVEALPRNWRKKAEKIYGITAKDLGGLEPGVYDFSCPRSEQPTLAVVTNGGKVFRITNQKIVRSVLEQSLAV